MEKRENRKREREKKKVQQKKPLFSTILSFKL